MRLGFRRNRDEVWLVEYVDGLYLVVPPVLVLCLTADFPARAVALASEVQMEGVRADMQMTQVDVGEPVGQRRADV